MKSTTLLTSLALLVTATCTLALDADEIKAIAAKPHDRSGLMKELSIYPEAREYRITVTFSAPDREPEKTPAFAAKEKVVEGKYVVSSFVPPGQEGAVVLVVTFDREIGQYRKWVLAADGTVSRSLGVSAKGSRAIAWRSLDKAPDGRTSPVGLEQHSPMETTFTEVFYKDGEQIYTVRGSAKVTLKE